ncbi:hypothetical protein [Streptomyces sp. NPDC048248]|uniref:hypothetical protein n=1 Tax=Streptomyces sp. NPDC048248 TaxID=3365523 RepID=UPI0037116D54
MATPDFGMLFNDMAHPDGTDIPIGAVLQPRVFAQVREVDGSTSRYVLIVLLGLAMAAQNAAARRLAVPDLKTTVLTQ